MPKPSHLSLVPSQPAPVAIVPFQQTGNAPYARVGERFVMLGGKPVYETALSIGDLQQWVTTLEEAEHEIGPGGLAGALSTMRLRFMAYLSCHQCEHEQAVTDAPTADDLLAYLASYTLAMRQ